MNFGDLGKKAEQFLDSDKGEKVSDEALEKAEGFADQRTGGTHSDQLEKAERFADDHIGERDA